MESNQFTQQGEQRSAILVSGKLFNDDDGLIWPTEGRILAPAGLCYIPLVVNQTTAGNMPRQQKAKNRSNDLVLIKGAPG